MNAPAILAAARAQGVSVTLVPGGTLAVRGPAEARGRLLPAIRESKPALVEALTPHRRWLVLFPDLPPVVADFCPPATREQVIGWHPGALSVEPYQPTPRPPNTPLSDTEGVRVRTWLAYIGETDPATISEVLDRCETDREARAYFLGRAGEVPGADAWDDRRTCTQCANLAKSGRCLAAARGELVATARDYRPPPDRLHRCERYAPGADDPDRRPGRERWPRLTEPRTN
jgi:hypothetical protein